jgi:hypothetical protein
VRKKRGLGIEAKNACSKINVSCIMNIRLRLLIQGRIPRQHISPCFRFTLRYCKNPFATPKTNLIVDSTKIKVVRWKSTEVSEEYVATIFRIEEYAKQEISIKQKASRALLLVYFLVYSSTLKIEAIYFFETSIDFQRTIWHYIPDNRSLLHTHCFQNLGNHLPDYSAKCQRLN